MDVDFSRGSGEEEGDWGFEIGHREGKFVFEDLLDEKVREFNPRYAEAEGALPGKFRHLHADIYGNREFVEHLRNRGKFYDHEEKRERDLILIDYAQPERNVYKVTEEFAFHNGHSGTRWSVPLKNWTGNKLEFGSLFSHSIRKGGKL